MNEKTASGKNLIIEKQLIFSNVLEKIESGKKPLINSIIRELSAIRILTK